MQPAGVVQKQAASGLWKSVESTVHCSLLFPLTGTWRRCYDVRISKRIAILLLSRPFSQCPLGG